MRKFAISLVLSYFRFFARIALQLHKPEIIGIAGSVGKSSTRNAIEATLEDYFPIKTVGNSETGIPLGILGLQPTAYNLTDWAFMLLRAPFGIYHLNHTRYLIAEMGIDEPGPPKNMEYLLTILKPDIAISLNVSATHTMQFEKTLSEAERVESALSDEQRTKNKEQRTEIVVRKIAEEDTKIITKSDCRVSIYNADDKNIREIVKDHNDKKNTSLTFGTSNTNDIFYAEYTVSLTGTSFAFSLKDETPKKITLFLKNMLLPEEYREVFAAAILTGLQSQLTLEQIKNGLEHHFSVPRGRASMFKGINSTIIVDSSYNASRAPVIAFLSMVKLLKKQTNRPVVFLFGDMRELGNDAEREHEKVTEAMVGIVDYLYLVGPLTRT